MGNSHIATLKILTLLEKQFYFISILLYIILALLKIKTIEAAQSETISTLIRKITGSNPNYNGGEVN